MISPLASAGLGIETHPPRLKFVLIIFLFSFFSGIFISFIDLKSGGKWVKPSISISPFGPGKRLQRQYLGSISFVAIGIGCMFINGGGHINWMGSLPFTIGVGLVAAINYVKIIHKSNFSPDQ